MIKISCFYDTICDGKVIKTGYFHLLYFISYNQMRHDWLRVDYIFAPSLHAQGG